MSHSDPALSIPVHYQSVFASGTCWGSYMVVRLSSYPEVKAGVSMHPSHSAIIGALGEDEAQILEEAKDSSYQLFMPTGKYSYK